jgi:hypothetical protein
MFAYRATVLSCQRAPRALFQHFQLRYTDARRDDWGCSSSLIITQRIVDFFWSSTRLRGGNNDRPTANVHVAQASNM